MEAKIESATAATDEADALSSTNNVGIDQVASATETPRPISTESDIDEANATFRANEDDEATPLEETGSSPDENPIEIPTAPPTLVDENSSLAAGSEGEVVIEAPAAGESSQGADSRAESEVPVKGSSNAKIEDDSASDKAPPNTPGTKSPAIMEKAENISKQLSQPYAGGRFKSSIRILDEENEGSDKDEDKNSPKNDTGIDGGLGDDETVEPEFHEKVNKFENFPAPYTQGPVKSCIKIIGEEDEQEEGSGSNDKDGETGESTEEHSSEKVKEDEEENVICPDGATSHSEESSVVVVPSEEEALAAGNLIMDSSEHNSDSPSVQEQHQQHTLHIVEDASSISRGGTRLSRMSQLALNRPIASRTTVRIDHRRDPFSTYQGSRPSTFAFSSSHPSPMFGARNRGTTFAIKRNTLKLGQAGNTPVRLELSDLEGGRNANQDGNKGKSESRTEITAGSDEDGSEDWEQHGPSTITIGSLLKDTYSFLYIYPICPPSAPTVYAFFLFFFQGLIYSLLLSSLIDVSNPRNPLHVPPFASVQMRIAQACAIVVAVANSVDIMVAMNNLLRPADSIVVVEEGNSEDGSETEGFVHSPPDTELSGISGIGAGISSSNVTSGVVSNSNAYIRSAYPTGIRFKIANLMRLVEGCLAIASSFILIVCSRDIIELFMNFAALEFVVNLDNLAFALAEHGLVSDRLQDAARFIDGLGYCYYDYDEKARDSALRRRTKKTNCTGALNLERASRLAKLKGACYMSICCLFQSPTKAMRNNPDSTRRVTLLIMVVSLLCAWAWTLSAQSYGDFLCRNLNVEFFHAHVPATLETDGGIKPFLSSRSGTYVAKFDRNQNFLQWLSNVVTGNEKRALAYQKVNQKVEQPLSLFQQVDVIPPSSPPDFVDVVFFDPNLKKWIFSSCSQDADLIGNDRTSSCIGLEIHSIETTEFDLTLLSSSAFHVVDGSSDYSALFLPASVSCNECISPKGTGQSNMASGNAFCSLSGGTCSPPQSDLGESRVCNCPPGQYGQFCNEPYAASCPIVEVARAGGMSEPGSVEFKQFELRQFELLPDERGIPGNSPIWERKFPGMGFVDRLERRGGTHWTITRNSTSIYTDFTSLKTVAIAEDPSASDGIAPGTAGAMLNQPPPSGLTWYVAKSAAWGTQPDFFRPFSAYEIRCRSVPAL